MEDAVRQVLNSITWEQEGFALATGRDEDTGHFTGLAIPYHDGFGPITDAVLLVRPDIALHQREEETAEPRRRSPAASPAPDGRRRRPGGTGGGGAATRSRRRPGSSACSGVDPRKVRTRPHRIQQEILPHLADAEAGDLTITVEVEATRPEGFSDERSASSPRMPACSSSSSRSSNDGAKHLPRRFCSATRGVTTVLPIHRWPDHRTSKQQHLLADELGQGDKPDLRPGAATPLTLRHLAHGPRRLFVSPVLELWARPDYCKPLRKPPSAFIDGLLIPGVALGELRV